jgi:hypothetical protein
MSVDPDSRYNDPNDGYFVGGRSVGVIGFALWAAFSVVMVFGVPTAVGYLVFTNAPVVGGAWWPYIRVVVTAIAALIALKAVVVVLTLLSIVAGIVIATVGEVIFG